MKSIKNFIRDERGWVTWLWSKMGVMIAFFVGLIIFISVYHYISNINDADMANQVSRGLADTIVEVWSAPPGYKTVYTLPARINGHDYEAELVGNSILIYVFGFNKDVKGGASVPAALTLDASPWLHDESDDEVILCVENMGENTVKIMEGDCVGGAAGGGSGSGSGDAKKPKCSNGVIDPGEECDGSNLNGEDCKTKGFDDGILKCANCKFDDSGCTQEKAKIEIISPTSGSDIEAWKGTFPIKVKVTQDSKEIFITLSGIPIGTKMSNNAWAEDGFISAKLKDLNSNQVVGQDESKNLDLNYAPNTYDLEDKDLGSPTTKTKEIETSLGNVEISFTGGELGPPVKIINWKFTNANGKSTTGHSKNIEDNILHGVKGKNTFTYTIGAYSNMKGAAFTLKPWNIKNIIYELNEGDSVELQFDFPLTTDEQVTPQLDFEADVKIDGGWVHVKDEGVPTGVIQTVYVLYKGDIDKKYAEYVAKSFGLDGFEVKSSDKVSKDVVDRNSKSTVPVIMVGGPKGGGGNAASEVINNELKKIDGDKAAYFDLSSPITIKYDSNSYQDQSSGMCQKVILKSDDGNTEKIIFYIAGIQAEGTMLAATKLIDIANSIEPKSDLLSINPDDTSVEICNGNLKEFVCIVDKSDKHIIVHGVFADQGDKDVAQNIKNRFEDLAEIKVDTCPLPVCAHPPIKSEEKENNPLILIGGSIANGVVNEFMDNNVNVPYGFKYTFDTTGEDIKIVSVDVDKTEQYLCGAIIDKVTQNERFIVTIAGIHKEDTQYAGNYIINNWEDIVTKESYSTIVAEDGKEYEKGEVKLPCEIKVDVDDVKDALGLASTSGSIVYALSGAENKKWSDLDGKNYVYKFIRTENLQPEISIEATEDKFKNAKISLGVHSENSEDDIKRKIFEDYKEDMDISFIDEPADADSTTDKIIYWHEKEKEHWLAYRSGKNRVELALGEPFDDIQGSDDDEKVKRGIDIARKVIKDDIVNYYKVDDVIVTTGEYDGIDFDNDGTVDEDGEDTFFSSGNAGDDKYIFTLNTHKYQLFDSRDVKVNDWNDNMDHKRMLYAKKGENIIVRWNKESKDIFPIYTKQWGTPGVNNGNDANDMIDKMDDELDRGEIDTICFDYDNQHGLVLVDSWSEDKGTITSGGKNLETPKSTHIQNGILYLMQRGHRTDIQNSEHFYRIWMGNVIDNIDNRHRAFLDLIMDNAGSNAAGNYEFFHKYCCEDNVDCLIFYATPVDWATNNVYEYINEFNRQSDYWADNLVSDIGVNRERIEFVKIIENCNHAPTCTDAGMVQFLTTISNCVDTVRSAPSPKIVGNKNQHPVRRAGFDDSGNICNSGGWTMRHHQDTAIVGMDLTVVAHEMGHTYQLCDEYSHAAWQNQDNNVVGGGDCPNAWPANCVDANGNPTAGLCPGSVRDGNTCIMGTGSRYCNDCDNHLSADPDIIIYQ